MRIRSGREFDLHEGVYQSELLILNERCFRKWFSESVYRYDLCFFRNLRLSMQEVLERVVYTCQIRDFEIQDVTRNKCQRNLFQDFDTLSRRRWPFFVLIIF